MARTPAYTTGEGSGRGGTFLAWGLGPQADAPQSVFLRGYGSYGRNIAFTVWLRWPLSDQQLNWRPQDIKPPASIPVFLDSAWPEGGFAEIEPPPPFDAIPTWMIVSPRSTPFCINRHDGFVNAGFLDWSVRKVGLKELWTLKWYRQFNTAGTWTRAGGAQPEDWPEWMRRFKDY